MRDTISRKPIPHQVDEIWITGKRFIDEVALSADGIQPGAPVPARPFGVSPLPVSATTSHLIDSGSGRTLTGPSLN
jgi:hypothetical protein